MAVITYRDALGRALDEEMARDAAGVPHGRGSGEYDGAYKVSKGLLAKYGPARVRDTPIAELGFTGAGVGAAIAGLRPVVEWMTHNFAFLAMDQVVNEAAKLRYMSGGQLSVPIVFRGPNGPAEYLASQHSQSLASFWTHVPGLKVLAPSTPADAYGLLKSAIRDDDPVVFLESELMYALEGRSSRGRVPRADRQGRRLRARGGRHDSDLLQAPARRRRGRRRARREGRRGRSHRPPKPQASRRGALYESVGRREDASSSTSPGPSRASALTSRTSSRGSASTFSTLPWPSSRAKTCPCPTITV